MAADSHRPGSLLRILSRIRRIGQEMKDGAIMPEVETSRGQHGLQHIGGEPGHVTFSLPEPPVGALWNVYKMFNLAAAYTSKLAMSNFGDCRDLFAQASGFDIPATGTPGLTVRLTDALTFSFDVQQIWHNDIKSVHDPVQNRGRCPTLGGNNIENGLGGNRGAGFGWQNVTVYRFGGAWKCDDTRTFRAGYSHTDQPIPTSQMSFNILAPGVVKDHYTVGFDRRASNKNELNLSFMYALRKTVTGPSNFDPSQTVQFSMDQCELEVSYSWKR